ncbi:hypothetical protein [Deinococcus sp. PEB2-63]
MKKAMMLFAALTLCAANAQNNPGGRSAGAASTDLIFNTTVVPGCAVNLDGSYISQDGATYNGTDVNPEKLEITVAGRGGNTMLRCQTGTTVTFGVTGGVSTDVEQTFNGTMDTPDPSNILFSGRLTLVLAGFQNTNNAGDDNKNVRGDYKVRITKNNVAGGNGDTYGMKATFTPDPGWFEAMVGEYTGTLVLNVDY